MINYLNQNPFYRFQSLKCIRRINGKNNVLLSIYTYLYLYTECCSNSNILLIIDKGITLIEGKISEKNIILFKNIKSAIQNIWMFISIREKKTSANYEISKY